MQLVYIDTIKKIKNREELESIWFDIVKNYKELDIKDDLMIGVYLGWIFLKTLSLDCNRKKMRDSLDNILPEIKKGFNIVYLGRYSDMPKKRLKKFLDYLDTCG